MPWYIIGSALLCLIVGRRTKLSGPALTPVLIALPVVATALTCWQHYQDDLSMRPFFQSDISARYFFLCLVTYAFIIIMGATSHMPWREQPSRQP